jgi:hypothetical protein
MKQASYEDLVSGARAREDMLSLVFAGVISRAIAEGRQPLIRGLSENRFRRLLNEYFPEFEIANGNALPGAADSEAFAKLVSFLIERRSEPTEQRAWLAYAVASCAMAPGVLWQEMGLPGPQLLDDLMRVHFPSIVAENRGSTEWKSLLMRAQDQRGMVSDRQ